jgi:uncharacterized membrane protein YphA (DoxX/SURF4 family)
MADIKAKPGTIRGMPSLSMIGLLVVQLIIGYEWLFSGIAKIAKGNFPSGLGDDLAEMSAGAAGWYAGFLNNVIIPNATAYGYIIEITEVLAGLALIVGALIWIFAWDRTSYGLRVTVIVLMIAASIGGIFMALNFHIANGANHPWMLPDSGFDEGVDIDLLLVTIQSVITVVQIIVLNRLRQERSGVVTGASAPGNILDREVSDNYVHNLH